MFNIDKLFKWHKANIRCDVVRLYRIWFRYTQSVATCRLYYQLLIFPAYFIIIIEYETTTDKLLEFAIFPITTF